MGKKRIVAQTTEEALAEKEKLEEALKKVQVKGAKKEISGKGNIYISSSYNNTMITVTDERGNVVAWSSAGALGFKGPKKATPFAASKVAEAILQKIQKVRLRDFSVFVRGIGAGRGTALKSLAGANLNIVSIKDVTPIPHNGPRPPKARRV